jgi:1,4-dihydroxy-6-naphthoate synthase
MNPLSLGYSPCPNDTFIFYALAHGRIPQHGLAFTTRLEDVETLNRLAFAGHLDVTKASCHALGHLRRDYALLHSGAALGRGCGPLVVAPRHVSMSELSGRRIAIPGALTTANLLLQLFSPEFEDLLILPFDQIMGAVQRGEAEAGVIIHESRFTFADYGLFQVLDLGQWWEEETGLPIPLGAILARRTLGPDRIAAIDRLVRASVSFARANPEAPREYIRAHAQELSEQVTANHIDLYVNDFSLELGNEGIEAIEALLTRAEARGIIPPCDLPLFLS